MTAEEAMTAEEVCRELGISRKTLYNRMKAKRIAPIRSKPALDREPLQFRRADVLALAAPRPPKPDRAEE